MDDYVPDCYNPAIAGLRGNGKPRKTKEQRGPRKRRHKNGQDPHKESFSNIDRISNVAPSEMSITSSMTSDPSKLSSRYQPLRNHGMSHLSTSFNQTGDTLQTYETNQKLPRFSASKAQPSFLFQDAEHVGLGSYQNWLDEENLIPSASFYPSWLAHNTWLSGDDFSTAAFSESSNEQWLHLQQEWTISKNRLLEENEMIAEENERRKWSTWADHASEIERQRRIQVLKDIEREQELERYIRRKWASEMIEKERNERISNQFLATLSSTQWFNDMISTYHEDYEMVCPYYRVGCRAKCKRSTIQKHLLECQHAIEITEPQDTPWLQEYEIVCPNTVMGCTFIGNKQALTKHLEICPYIGSTMQQELVERQLMREMVILECEEERLRRLNSDDHHHLPKKSNRSYFNNTDDKDKSFNVSDISEKEGIGSHELPSSSGKKDISSSSGSSSTSNSTSSSCSKKHEHLLHAILQKQMNEVMADIHDEVDSIWTKRTQKTAYTEKIDEFKHQFIQQLEECIQSLWPFSRVEIYGSSATGLTASGSGDLDLVICFSDEYMDMISMRGIIPLLHALSDHLERKAKDFLSILNVFLHARIPVIKAEVCGTIEWEDSDDCIDDVTQADNHSSMDSDSDTSAKTMILRKSINNRLRKKTESFKLSVDISLDGPAHSGLATTEFVKVMLHTLPPLGPLYMVLKDYLKASNLCNAFTGGLPSYGLILLLLIPLLRQVEKERKRQEVHHHTVTTAQSPANGIRNSRSISVSTVDNHINLPSHDSFNSMTRPLSSPTNIRKSGSQTMTVDSPRERVAVSLTTSRDMTPLNNNNGVLNRSLHRSLRVSKGSDISTTDIYSPCIKVESDKCDHVLSIDETETVVEVDISNTACIQLDASDPTTPYVLPACNPYTTSQQPSSHTYSPSSSSSKIPIDYSHLNWKNTRSVRSYSSPKTFFSHYAAASSTFKSNPDIDQRCRDSRQRSFSQVLSRPSNGSSFIDSPNRKNNNIHKMKTAQSSQAMNTCTSVAPSILFYPAGLYVNPSPLIFSSIDIQREYGRKVALKILAFDSNSLIYNSDECVDIKNKPRRSTSFASYGVPNSYSRRPSKHISMEEITVSSILLTNHKPIYGLILKEFFKMYGEEMQCGKHGYSMREGGFRFNVHGSDGYPSHPHACDPMLIEDPIDIFNNVARNCFRCSLIQRSFLEAHEKLKGLAVRYHQYKYQPSHIKMTNETKASRMQSSPEIKQRLSDSSDTSVMDTLERNPIANEADTSSALLSDTHLALNQVKNNDSFTALMTNISREDDSTAATATITVEDDVGTRTSVKFSPQNNIDDTSLMKPDERFTSFQLLHTTTAESDLHNSTSSQESKFNEVRARFERMKIKVTSDSYDDKKQKNNVKPSTPSLSVISQKTTNITPFAVKKSPRSSEIPSTPRHEVITDESRNRFLEAKALFESLSPRNESGVRSSQNGANTTSRSSYSSRHASPVSHPPLPPASQRYSRVTLQEGRGREGRQDDINESQSGQQHTLSYTLEIKQTVSTISSSVLTEILGVSMITLIK